MSRFCVALVTVAVACGPIDDRSASRAAGAPRRGEAAGPRAVDRVVPGVPHGGTVTRVAIDDDGSAAITADDLGSLRLWLTLDGTRAPVPIAASAPRELAIARAGEELVVAIVDEAGTARVVRVAPSGAERGRATLAGDAAVRQIAFAGADLLVLRADQSIERFDARGARRGRVVAEAGERIGAIAARRGAALASIIGEGHTSKRLRWLALDGELRWASAVDLPVEIVPGALALAPHHQRVAILDATSDASAARNKAGESAKPMPNIAQTWRLAVYELSPAALQVTPVSNIRVTDGNTFGFTDDDHVAAVLRGGVVQWWTSKPPAAGDDPWSPDAPPRIVLADDGAGAIGDGVAAFASTSGIALARPEQKPRYLGWATFATSYPTSVGDRVVYGPVDGKLLWLDGRLAEHHTFELKTVANVQQGWAVAVDDHRVIVQTEATDPDKKGRGARAFVLVDTAHPEAPTPIGQSDGPVYRQLYDARRRVLSVGTPTTVMRWTIDATRNTASELPTISVGQLTGLYLLDPARSHGESVAVTSWQPNGKGATAIDFYGDDNPATPRREVSPGPVQAIAGDGTIYEIVRDAHPVDRSGALVVRRAGKELARVALDDAAVGVVTSHTSGGFAVVGTTRVAVYDAHATLRWQREVWRNAFAVFSDDDSTLFVRANSGVLAIDVRTGELHAQACAWEFGLHDAPLPRATFGESPVCED